MSTAANTSNALLRGRDASLRTTSRTCVRVGRARLACRPLATRIGSLLACTEVPSPLVGEG